MKFYISFFREKISSFPVIYMRRIGEYGDGNYALMDSFKKWIKMNGLYDEDTVIYAVPMDNPEIIEAHKCRYDVCVKQPTKQTFLSVDVKSRTLDGGNYLCFLIPHTIDAVNNAWRLFLAELEELGYCMDEGRPIMERYQKKLVDNHYCELCIPILY